MVDTAVIVLNWNGWKDTCECLTSLLNSSYQNFQVVLIDNGSTDDSLEKIRLWAGGKFPVSVGPFTSQPQTHHVRLVEVDLSEFVDGEQFFNYTGRQREAKVVLLKSRTNLGFARGSNVGIRYGLDNNFGKMLLLNNDTTVEPGCLEILSSFLDQNRTYDVITPKICFYDQPGMIWNCGGALTFSGSRRYFCQDQKDDGRIDGGMKDITFITGCALFARATVFKKYGLLSEKFFFGEEDYEFSLRMRKNNVKMASVLSARLYHKISASTPMIFAKNESAYAFVALLNRWIDMKSYYSRLYWRVWRVASLVYTLPMLKIKRKIPFRKGFKLVRLLFMYSSTRTCVSRDDVFRVREIFT